MKYQLRSLSGCKLTIGNYPTFNYNASGGGGFAVITAKERSEVLSLEFNPKELIIPPLNWRTTKFLGLPLPPGIQISIQTEKLAGTISTLTGIVSLHFIARFSFTIGKAIKAPDLIVQTILKTSEVGSKGFDLNGKSLKNNGRITLMGLANIPITGNKLMDYFLNLPNDALASLECELIEKE